MALPTSGRAGLSPHSRGKQRAFVQVGFDPGSIPAFTGETRRITSCPVRCKVYPRIHGGNEAGAGLGVGVGGLSPHSRGKR